MFVMTQRLAEHPCRQKCSCKADRILHTTLFYFLYGDSSISLKLNASQILAANSENRSFPLVKMFFFYFRSVWSEENSVLHFDRTKHKSTWIPFPNVQKGVCSTSCLGMDMKETEDTNIIMLIWKMSAIWGQNSHNAMRDDEGYDSVPFNSDPDGVRDELVRSYVWMNASDWQYSWRESRRTFWTNESQI